MLVRKFLQLNAEQVQGLEVGLGRILPHVQVRLQILHVLATPQADHVAGNGVVLHHQVVSVQADRKPPDFECLLLHAAQPVEGGLGLLACRHESELLNLGGVLLEPLLSRD